MKLSPILNRDKLFELAPPSAIPSNDLLSLSLPNDWLTQLENRCREQISDLAKDCFDRHIKAQPILTEALQRIYCYLFGYPGASSNIPSESSQMAVIVKLTEDITSCTDGFHNRLNEIGFSLKTPRSLSELLYQIRANFVKNLGAKTLSVHTANQFTKVAAAMGLGIKANFENDPNSGYLSDEVIKGSLTDEFESQYVPFHLPFLLSEYLSGLLQEIGYSGLQENGYSVGVAEKISNKIKCYLTKKFNPMDWQAFFIIDTNEEDEFDIVIRDLDWNFIRHCFFSTLIENGYFIQVPSDEDIVSLLDCACFNHLFSNNKLLDIETHHIAELEEKDAWQIKKIKTDFPDYWEKLKPLFKEAVSAIINKPSKALNSSDFSKLSLFFELDLIHLITDDNLITKLVELIKFERFEDQNLLLWAVRSHPQAIGPLLKFISQHLDQFPRTTLAHLFLEKDVNGLNISALAAYSAPNEMDTLLDFVSEGIAQKKFDPSTFSYLFLESKTNTFHLAVQRPKVLQAILEFISQHVDQFDSNALTQMFQTQLNYKDRKLYEDPYVYREGQGNLLKLAIRQPESLKSLLTFISQHRDQFSSELLPNLLLVKNQYGWNPLLLAVKFYPDSAKHLLEFISQHIDQFDSNTLTKLFLEKNKISEVRSAMEPNTVDSCTHIIGNLLQTATPETRKTIVEFIGQHYDKFDPNALARMFIKKNFNNPKLLLNFVKQNFEATQKIVEFIFPHIELKIAGQMFLARKEQHWNSFMAKLWLEKYLADLYIRKEKNITHTTRFFKLNFGFSTQKKINAALALKEALTLEGTQQWNRLVTLSYDPIFDNGRLGKVFVNYYQLAYDAANNNNDEQVAIRPR
jgi:hypothetical protein